MVRSFEANSFDSAGTTCSPQPAPSTLVVSKLTSHNMQQLKERLGMKCRCQQGPLPHALPSPSFEQPMLQGWQKVRG